MGREAPYHTRRPLHRSRPEARGREGYACSRPTSRASPCSPETPGCAGPRWRRRSHRGRPGGPSRRSTPARARSPARRTRSCRAARRPGPTRPALPGCRTTPLRPEMPAHARAAVARPPWHAGRCRPARSSRTAVRRGPAFRSRVGVRSTACWKDTHSNSAVRAMYGARFNHQTATFVLSATSWPLTAVPRARMHATCDGHSWPQSLSR